MIRPFLREQISLLLLAALPLIFAACGDKKPTAIILISLDTLRQDHLSCYGYGRSTSPMIDRFAEEDAVLFKAAYAQAPLTLPSHMSMLTGLYPEAHGILHSNLRGKGPIQRLADPVVTLADACKAQGFTTAAFTDGLLLDSKYGFDQGFDLYVDDRKPLKAENGFARFEAEMHQWIRDHVEEDFFLFVHTYDTHAPYAAPEPFANRFSGEPPGRELPQASMIYSALLGLHNSFRLIRYSDLQGVVDHYDGCIAFADYEVGRLFALLKELGRWEDALIVVTSDHGEAFMENRMIGHGLQLYNEEVLIPLIMKLPGSRHGGRRVDHVVESVDIMPTILSALHVPIPSELQGQNLLAGLERDRWEKSHAYGTSPNAGSNHYLFHNGIKFIEAVNDPGAWLLRAHLRPNTPPMCSRPAKPYSKLNKRPYYYNFDEDPLGVFELFHRGDHAFRVAPGAYEWKAEPMEDRELLMRYKEMASDIAQRSREIGQRYRTETSHEHLTEMEIDQLIALGYGGMIAASRLENEGETREPSDEITLIITPSLTDRSLLYQGDAFLWEIVLVYSREKKISMAYDRFAAGLAKARENYEAFQRKNPDKWSWVRWRMKCLDLVSAIMDKQMNKDR